MKSLISRKISLESPLPPSLGTSPGTVRLSRTWVAGCALALAAIGSAPLMLAQAPDAIGGAQETSPSTPGGHRGGGQYAGMGRAGGEVTAVSGNTLTVKGENGRPVTIVTTDNTRVMKDRGPVKASDLHGGDGLMAFGNMDPATGTLHAAMVMATDASELKAMRENLGKTYITGRVTAVNLDDAKMTVERPDHVAQTIGFDESTSFKRAVHRERGANSANAGGGDGPEGRNDNGPASGGMGMGGGMGAMASGGAALDRAFANGESITLAEIKVGDNVTGTGSVKGGIFVPLRLLESPQRPPRTRSAVTPGGAANGSGAAGPGAAGPGQR